MSLPTTCESDKPSRFMTSRSPVDVTARRLMDPSNTVLHSAIVAVTVVAVATIVVCLSHVEYRLLKKMVLSEQARRNWYEL